MAREKSAISRKEIRRRPGRRRGYPQFELETTAPVRATTLVTEWHHIENGKISRVQSVFDCRPFEGDVRGRSHLELAGQNKGRRTARKEETIADISPPVGINAPADKVFKALSEQTGLADWWEKNVSVPPGVGAVTQFRFDHKCFNDMKVLVLRRGKLVGRKVTFLTICRRGRLATRLKRTTAFSGSHVLLCPARPASNSEGTVSGKGERFVTNQRQPLASYTSTGGA
jgi:hypothetical protein